MSAVFSQRGALLVKLDARTLAILVAAAAPGARGGPSSTPGRRWKCNSTRVSPTQARQPPNDVKTQCRSPTRPGRSRPHGKPHTLVTGAPETGVMMRVGTIRDAPAGVTAPTKGRNAT